jgi:hypothetical protein
MRRELQHAFAGELCPTPSPRRRRAENQGNGPRCRAGMCQKGDGQRDSFAGVSACTACPARSSVLSVLIARTGERCGAQRGHGRLSGLRQPPPQSNPSRDAAHSRCAGRVPELPTENEAENGPTERRRRTVQRDAVGDDCPWPRASRRLLVAGPEKVWRPIQRSLAHHFGVSRRDWLQANRRGALLSGPYCSVSLMLSRSAAEMFSG